MIFAKKSLGQHFLRSERALTEIIQAAKITPGERVLEIGPGEGVLTEKLLAYSLQVVAVEKDDNLYELLKNKFAKEIAEGKFVLIHDDILNFDPTSLQAVSYKLVANIPYNITGAIFEKFLSATAQPSLIVLLVQDEVAKRAVARDGKESILSISIKVYGNPRYVDKVLAGSFVPAPSVHSAILAVEDISKNFFTSFSEQDFFKLLKAGFQSKRKKMSSNLAAVADKEQIREAFAALTLDENTRAEDVDKDTWRALATALLSKRQYQGGGVI